MFRVLSSLRFLPLVFTVACSGGGGSSGGNGQPISNDTGAIAGFWDFTDPDFPSDRSFLSISDDGVIMQTSSVIDVEECWETIPGYIGRIGPNRYVIYFTNNEVVGPLGLTVSGNRLSINYEDSPRSESLPRANSTAFDGTQACDYDSPQSGRTAPTSLEEVPLLEARDVTPIAGIFAGTRIVNGEEVARYFEIKAYGVANVFDVVNSRGTECLDFPFPVQVSNLGDNQYQLGVARGGQQMFTASVNDNVMTTSLSESGQPFPLLEAIPSDIPRC